MVDGASRDVTYTLRLVGAPENARTLADMIAAQKAIQAAAEKSEEAKRKEIERTAKATKKAADDEERAALKAFQNRLRWNEIVRVEKAKSVAEAEKAEANAAKAAEKAAREAQAAQAKAEAAKRREMEATAKAAAKAAAETEKAALRSFQNQLKWNEIVRTERAKAEADAARQYETAVAKMTSAQEKLKSVVASGTEGLIRMARGAAMLGIAGEKDAKKLLDALVKIQAAYDIAKGAIEFYYGLTEAVKSYRAAVLSAAAAEAALNATRRGGAATSAASVGALGATGVGLAGAAAVVGVGAAGYAAYELGSGKWREEGSYFRTGGAAWESVGTGVGQFIGVLGKGEQAYFDAAEAVDTLRVAAISGAAEQRRAEQAIRDMADVARDVGRGQMATFRSDLMLRRSGRGDLATQSRGVVLAGNELRSREREVASRLSGRNITPDELDRLNQEAVSLAERQASLLEQRLQLERQSADIGVRAARERIAAAERERDIASEIVARERERNMTVLERFGQMSRGEQAQLLAVREKADRFGAAALSQRERSQLRSIGTSSAERLAREGDVAAATAAGGNRLFRAEDFAAERAAEQRRVQAELVISDQRRIEVVVEANYDALARNIQGQLTQQLDDLEVLVARMVESKIATEQGRARDRLNQERIAAQQAR